MAYSDSLPSMSLRSRARYRDQVALNFEETYLRLSDVRLLKGRYWLSDQIISFYFVYLEKLIVKDDENFLFVSPEVTQCIRMVPEAEIGVFLDPLKATQRSFIFFVLNNNQFADQAGGSHWSLLVYSRPEMSFHHFDSAHNTNLKICRQLVNTLKRALHCPEAQFIAEECLQQRNDYDCGVHLLCNVDKVTEQIRTTGNIEGVSSTPHDVIVSKRKDILNIIVNLGGRIK